MRKREAKLMEGQRKTLCTDCTDAGVMPSAALVHEVGRTRGFVTLWSCGHDDEGRGPTRIE